MPPPDFSRERPERIHLEPRSPMIPAEMFPIEPPPPVEHVEVEVKEAVEIIGETVELQLIGERVVPQSEVQRDMPDIMWRQMIADVEGS